LYRWPCGEVPRGVGGACEAAGAVETPPARSRAPIVWGEAARALFELTGPTAVSAGAGSGKTTALVELTVRLLGGEALGSPCAPSELAAITFTEKAAAELDERIRAAVRDRLARARSEAAPADVAAWTERLSALDRMVIGTIHGFCGGLLREHAVEAGIDPEYEVVDEERSSGWLREAAAGAILAALDRRDEATSLLCAGMGLSGGRGGLADALVSLVRGRAWRGDERPPSPSPDRVEEAEGARRALADGARALFEARGEAGGPSGRRAMEAFATAFAGLSPEDLDGPLEATGRLLALADGLNGWRPAKADSERILALRDAFKEGVEQLPPLVAEALAGPQKRALCALVEEAERRYREKKRAERALDFDDLLVQARDLLQGDGALRAELRRRFRAFLVDEYQDVNPVQQELFQLIAGPGEPPGPTLVAVGDLKQSIYRFRGADVAVFAGLVRAHEAGAGRVLSLADNHRSVPALLALANAVSARALQPADGEPRPWEIRFGPRDALVPRREGGLATACELLVDGSEGSAAELRRREARAIAARIGALVTGRAGVEVRERGGNGVERARRPRHGDVAILLRRLTQVAVYERALREAGVPFRLARGGGFYQAPEVRDLGELLASLAEPGDPVAWAALLRSPFCAVSDGTLLRLSRLGFGSLPHRGEAELQGAVPGPAEAARLARFLGTWRELRALRDRLPVDELLSRAIEALDVDAALLASPDGGRRLQNVEKALALAARHGRAGGTAAELAAHLRAQAERPPREPEAELDPGDAVAILTVHKAKGLEWPIVFVPDLGAKAKTDGRRAAIGPDGRITVSRFDAERETWTSPASLEAVRAEERRAGAAESRRLLYVALTRARDFLVLSGEGEGKGEPTWRGLVERALEAEPALARRVPLADAATSEAAPALPPAEPTPAPPVEPAAGPPPALSVPAPPVRMPVTDLAEYVRCPRRHLLGRTLGLPEPRAESGAHPDDDPARATARGTLAHAMLAEADLAAPPLERRAQLEAAALRRGYDPRSPAVRRILGEVARFVESPSGRALAELAPRGGLLREVPFLLRLDGEGGAACYLVGAIDALAVDPRARCATVVDYKYAVPRAGAAERYRVQLLAYALATARAHPGFTVRARLQFLRGDARAVDVTPSGDELRRFAAEAPALAAEAARGGGDRPPEALGRSVERCRAEGCGWASRCFRATSPGLRLRASGSIP
jgi:ATP-dependent exoDNAse (exonuclease V) beta subunit